MFVHYCFTFFSFLTDIVSVSPVRVVTAAISQLVELEAMVLSVDDSQAI